MEAKLVINGKKLALGHRELNEISYVLDDSLETREIYHELAKFPVTEIKANVATQRNLFRKTVRLLLSETQTDVMRNASLNIKFISKMNKEDIERFIDTEDTEILTNLVNNLSELTEEFEICEKDWLCEKLYHQKDPAVRYELAENIEASLFILKRLAEDADINVAKAAQETLEDIEDDFEGDDDSEIL